MKIGCVILSGGKSRRMGQDKALLDFHGKTFIEQIMHSLDFFEEKYISIGDREINTSWPTIKDIYPDHGPIGGIYTALLKCQSDAMFVVSCDLPLISPAFIQTLCQVMNKDMDGVVVKEASGRVHPLCAIYKKSTVDIFEKQILSNHNRLMDALNQMNIKYVEVETTQQLLNINTPEDYLALLTKE